MTADTDTSTTKSDDTHDDDATARAPSPARRARRRARSEGDAVAALVGKGARDVASTASERIEEEVERRKAEGTDRLSRIADAIEGAGEALEEELPPVADLVYRASDEVDALAAAVRERNARELAGAARSFVRRRPAAFAGLAGLAGFAAVRLLTAEAPDEGDEYDDGYDAAGDYDADGYDADGYDREDGDDGNANDRRDDDRRNDDRREAVPRSAFEDSGASGDPGSVAPEAPGFGTDGTKDGEG